MTTQTNKQHDIALSCSQHLQAAARQAYDHQAAKQVDDHQIEALLPMVHKIIQRVVSYIKPPLTYDDLVSAGTLGLVKAAHDYDPGHNAEFKTYAYIRIKGAVLDELRSWSFVPANVDKQIRQISQASSELSEEIGSPPTDEQLAEKAGISLEKLYETFSHARIKQFFSLDTSSSDLPGLSCLLPSDQYNNPEQRLEKEELIDQLVKAIGQLHKRQQQIIILYYQKQLTMKEIAEVFDISEARVSQLHSSALFNLSTQLRQWNDGG